MKVRVKDIKLEPHQVDYGDGRFGTVNYIDMKWKDIRGNAFDDSRMYACTSYDEEWACFGVILLDGDEQTDNPTIRINSIYKLTQN